PDGAALYLGTMFAPVQDRDAPGLGFTHKIGDVTTVAADKLGALVNRMRHAQDCARWEFGAAALMRYLAARRALRPGNCSLSFGRRFGVVKRLLVRRRLHVQRAETQSPQSRHAEPAVSVAGGGRRGDG